MWQGCSFCEDTVRLLILGVFYVVLVDIILYLVVSGSCLSENDFFFGQRDSRIYKFWLHFRIPFIKGKNRDFSFTDIFAFYRRTVAFHNDVRVKGDNHNFELQEGKQVCQAL